MSGRAKWVETFKRQWALMRRKEHGGGQASLRASIVYAWSGAWLASRWGPNPMKLMFWWG